MKIKTVKKIILIFYIINIGCENVEIDISGLAPDVVYTWDTDGDGISNNTENNSANSHHGFDIEIANENPSIAQGTPYNGDLFGGINLWGEGSGYKQWRNNDEQDTDDWGTLHLINMIEMAGRMLIGDQDHPLDEWAITSDNPNYTGRYGVLDLSLQYGGIFIPHESHQNGLDVDIRYVRTDRTESSFNFDDDPIDDYDYWATMKLIEAIYHGAGGGVGEGNITTIYCDERPDIAVENFTVEYISGHQHHFHVRIEDPDGTDN